MRIWDGVLRAGRSLKNAKGRTILTSLAIAVGAFTLTVTLSAGNGIRAYTDRLIRNNFDPSESIVGRDPEIENNSGPPNSSPKEYDDSVASMAMGGNGSIQMKQITDADIAQLKKFDFVSDVRPNYQINARYITREKQKKYTLSVEAFNPGQRPDGVAGTIPKADVEKGSVILPEEYVKLLGYKDANAAVGSTVTIGLEQPFTQEAVQQYLERAGEAMMVGEKTNEKMVQTKLATFKVAAVAKKGAAALTPAGLPVLVNASDAKELYDYTTKGTPQAGKYMYAIVKVKNGADDVAAADAKEAMKKQGYYAMTSQDLQKTIGQFVDILQALAGVFGIITVIASVFGIINTMYISVLERTREIGLMKALGMRGSAVAWLFRLEAAWIGLIGGALGATLAIGAGMALNPWITKTLSLGKGNDILVFDPLQITVLVASLTLVGIIAGWLPARKAAKLDPIVALRSE